MRETTNYRTRNRKKGQAERERERGRVRACRRSDKEINIICRERLEGNKKFRETEK